MSNSRTEALLTAQEIYFPSRRSRGLYGPQISPSTPFFEVSAESWFTKPTSWILRHKNWPTEPS